MATPEKDALARQKTEQFPQPEFIDVTAAFPGEGETEQPIQNEDDQEETESPELEQESSIDRPIESSGPDPDHSQPKE
jgi:hypothetical protein